MGAFGGYQNEIYTSGLDDVTPELPTDLTRLEGVAEERMPASAFAYVAGSAGSESTARANRAAFERWRIVPRMLRDVSTTDLSVTVLGTSMPAPVALAPIGVLSIVHPDGESAVARAAAALGVPMVVSTAASTSLEDVAAAGGDGARWYQLYWPKDRELAVSFLERAAAARIPGARPHARHLHDGVATTRPGQRVPAVPPRDRQPELLRRSRLPGSGGRTDRRREPRGRDRALGSHLRQPHPDLGRPRVPARALGRPHRAQGDPARRRRPARRGRRAWTASSSPTTAAARWTARSRRSTPCPAIVEAVGDQVEVLFDSGVRTGADVVKPLALGARAVLLGRPYAYGLGLAGEAGVRHVLRCVLAELELTIALSGATRPDELTPELLVRT